MTTVPRNSPKKNDTRKYSLWEWSRAYLVLALWIPFFPLLMLLDGRTLPAWFTRKLLQAHVAWTSSHPMDFRIPPDSTTPVYMERWWRIARNWASNVYYHIVRRSDDDRALHDHPWTSFSIVLDQGYWEHTILAGGVHSRTWFGPGRMRFRWTGKFAHRLELATDINGYDEEHELPTRTIFITGPVLRRWGFHDPAGRVDAYDWDTYCDARGIKSMRMLGGSDAVVSDRNIHSLNKDQ